VSFAVMENREFDNEEFEKNAGKEGEMKKNEAEKDEIERDKDKNTTQHRMKLKWAHIQSVQKSGDPGRIDEQR
jgi:hypothetical protein